MATGTCNTITLHLQLEVCISDRALQLGAAAMTPSLAFSLTLTIDSVMVLLSLISCLKVTRTAQWQYWGKQKPISQGARLPRKVCSEHTLNVERTAKLAVLRRTLCTSLLREHLLAGGEQ